MKNVYTWLELVLIHFSRAWCVVKPFLARIRAITTKAINAHFLLFSSDSDNVSNMQFVIKYLGNTRRRQQLLKCDIIKHAHELKQTLGRSCLRPILFASRYIGIDRWFLGDLIHLVPVLCTAVRWCSVETAASAISSPSLLQGSCPWTSTSRVSLCFAPLSCPVPNH